MEPLLLSPSESGTSGVLPARNEASIKRGNFPKIPMILLVSLLVVQSIEIIIMPRARNPDRAYSEINFETTSQVVTVVAALIVEKFLFRRSLESAYSDPSDAARMLVPAALISFGELIYIVGLFNLPIGLSKMPLYLSILFTASGSRFLIGRKYTLRQWWCHLGATVSLGLLWWSVLPSLVSQEMTQSTSFLLGFVCIFLSSLIWSSGKLFMEMIMKDRGTSSVFDLGSTPAPRSIWIRISQFAFFSIFTKSMEVWLTNQAATTLTDSITNGPMPSLGDETHWFFYGFTPLLWVCVLAKCASVMLYVSALHFVDAVLSEYSIQFGKSIAFYICIMTFNGVQFKFNQLELVFGVLLAAASSWFYFQDHAWENLQ